MNFWRLAAFSTWYLLALPTSVSASEPILQAALSAPNIMRLIALYSPQPSASVAAISVTLEGALCASLPFTPPLLTLSLYQALYGTAKSRYNGSTLATWDSKRNCYVTSAATCIPFTYDPALCGGDSRRIVLPPNEPASILAPWAQAVQSLEHLASAAQRIPYVVAELVALQRLVISQNTNKKAATQFANEISQTLRLSLSRILDLVSTSPVAYDSLAGSCISTFDSVMNYIRNGTIKGNTALVDTAFECLAKSLPLINSPPSPSAALVLPLFVRGLVLEYYQMIQVHETLDENSLAVLLTEFVKNDCNFTSLTRSLQAFSVRSNFGGSSCYTKAILLLANITRAICYEVHSFPQAVPSIFSCITEHISEVILPVVTFDFTQEAVRSTSEFLGDIFFLASPVSSCPSCQIVSYIPFNGTIDFSLTVDTADFWSGIGSVVRDTTLKTAFSKAIIQGAPCGAGSYLYLPNGNVPPDGLVCVTCPYGLSYCPGDGLCHMCSNAPENAEYLAPEGNSNSICPWTCNSTFYLVNSTCAQPETGYYSQNGNKSACTIPTGVSQAGTLSVPRGLIAFSGGGRTRNGPSSCPLSRHYRSVLVLESFQSAVICPGSAFSASLRICIATNKEKVELIAAYAETWKLFLHGPLSNKRVLISFNKTEVSSSPFQLFTGQSYWLHIVAGDASLEFWLGDTLISSHWISMQVPTCPFPLSLEVGIGGYGPQQFHGTLSGLILSPTRIPAWIYYSLASNPLLGIANPPACATGTIPLNGSCTCPWGYVTSNGSCRLCASEYSLASGSSLARASPRNCLCAEGEVLAWDPTSDRACLISHQLESLGSPIVTTIEGTHKGTKLASGNSLLVISVNSTFSPHRFRVECDCANCTVTCYSDNCVVIPSSISHGGSICNVTSSFDLEAYEPLITRTAFLVLPRLVLPPISGHLPTVRAGKVLVLRHIFEVCESAMSGCVNTTDSVGSAVIRYELNSASPVTEASPAFHSGTLVVTAGDTVCVAAFADGFYPSLQRTFTIPLQPEGSPSVPSPASKHKNWLIAVVVIAAVLFVVFTAIAIYRLYSRLRATPLTSPSRAPSSIAATDDFLIGFPASPFHTPPGAEQLASGDISNTVCSQCQVSVAQFHDSALGSLCHNCNEKINGFPSRQTLGFDNLASLHDDFAGELG